MDVLLVTVVVSTSWWKEHGGWALFSDTFEDFLLKNTQIMICSGFEDTFYTYANGYCDVSSYEYDNLNQDTTSATPAL